MSVMEKDLFLKSVAETGYNVGFGSRKHWATYDIVDKVPGLIAFGSMAFGIYSLVLSQLSEKSLSATLLVLGLIGLYISFYENKKLEYERSATKLTQLCNELRELYRSVQAADAVSDTHRATLSRIESTYYENCISKQILFSDWYAHYKFFWQYQINWIDEQKNFSLLRDKFPLSLMIWLAIIALLGALYFWDFTLCYSN